MIALASLGINLVVLVVNSRTKADIAQLRSEIFEKFVRREDMPVIYPLQKRERVR